QRRVRDQPAKDLLGQTEQPSLVVTERLAELLAELALGQSVLPLEIVFVDVGIADRCHDVAAEPAENIPRGDAPDGEADDQNGNEELSQPTAGALAERVEH